MNNESCSLYRGCAIITRSTELPPLSACAELSLASTWSTPFAASFCVNPDDERIDSWQEFPRGRFATRSLACANALSEARRSIDVKLADAADPKRPGADRRSSTWANSFSKTYIELHV